MKSKINNRKLEHVEIVSSHKNIDKSTHHSCFDQVKLIHRALPELSLCEIDTSVEFLGYNLSMPLIISSMTGGNDPLLKKINANLALAAQKTKIALAVGSQRVMKNSQTAKDSFNLRNIATDIPLIANVGAVQLNYEVGLTDIEYFIDFLKADALYLHSNPLQEAVQQEGNTDFSNLGNKISHLVENLPISVILKEVGCGMSSYDIELGLRSGLKYFDLAGFGGTSWSLIEYIRSLQNKDDSSYKGNLGLLFQNWGISTLDSLKIAQKYHDQALFIASGGIRNGIDIAKSIIFGASLCGVAQPFLHAALESSDKVIEIANGFQQELKLTMFLLGAKNIKELFMNKDLILKSEC